MLLMVFLGAIYRFYIKWPIAPIAFVGSCVVFGCVVAGILYPIEAELCGPGANTTLDGRCPITDPKLQYDRDAVKVLTYVWLGYPVVSLAADRFTKYSLFKDTCYAVLDVVAKAGLALYVCFRTTWV